MESNYDFSLGEPHMKKKICLIFCMVIVISIAASYIWGNGWIIYHDGPYQGRVIDADSGAPIEGAAVVGVWKLEAYGGPEPASVYCDTCETSTDKNGQFIVPKAFCFNLWPLAKLGMPQFVVFKPGYLSYPPRDFRTAFFTGEEFRDNKKYQIIRVGKAKTFSERRSALSLVDIFHIEKVPYLKKLLNEESKYLGFNK